MRHPILTSFRKSLSFRMQLEEEDPVEAYKREFQRKRWQKEQEAKKRRIEIERQTHRIGRYLACPIAVFAFVLLLDKYLPANIYNEVAEMGWQESIHQKRGPTIYISYMQTETFVFTVPADAHLNYPYYDTDKPPIKIDVTPIFNIPVHVSYTLGEYFYSFEIPETIHTMKIPLTWMLLLSSLFTILAKEYTMMTYSLAFLPMLLLAFVVLKMM
jgi:hypothetical protein